MNFVYPEFLFALSALAIPVIIHLFNFRKFKKIVFTNVRFLQEIKKDTQSRTRLKHLLVLLCRLLALSFLVFAFARPFIPGESQVTTSGEKRVGIFIDNSFSTESNGTNGVILEEEKRKARDIIESYASSTRFQILTCDFEPRHQRLVNKELALEYLSEIKKSPSSRSLSEITSRLSDAMRQDPSPALLQAYLLSDFQKSICDFNTWQPDSQIIWKAIPFSSPKRNNLFIDSCWFASPVLQRNQAAELLVRIRNNSSETVENNSCKLFINTRQKGLASFSVESESFVELKIPFTVSDTGFQHAYVVINDYPVTFDDTYFFSFAAAASIPILCVNQKDENKYLNQLYSGDSVFIYSKAGINQIDYSSLSSNRLIILNEVSDISTGFGEEIKKFVNSGGNLVIFPPAEMNSSLVNGFLQNLGAGTFETMQNEELRFANINASGEFLKNVFVKIPGNMDLPMVKKFYPLKTNTGIASESLINLQDASKFLSVVTSGKGKIYQFACPLQPEFSNFQKHALFVPVMYKIAFLSNPNYASSFVIGREEGIETSINPGAQNNVLHLKNTDGSVDIIPEIKNVGGKINMFVHNQIQKAGNYTAGITKTEASVSFNYDRAESKMEYFPADELNATFAKHKVGLLDAENKKFNELISASAEGKPLWKYALLLALCFLLLEVMLLRFLK